jgi:hypothetical protein
VTGGDDVLLNLCEVHYAINFVPSVVQLTYARKLQMSTGGIREVVKLTAPSFVRYIQAHADANLENFRAKISRVRRTGFFNSDL